MAIQLEDLVARLRLDTSGVGAGLGGVTGSLSSVGDKATAVGKKMTLGVTTPIVGLGIASVNLAATFDKTMRQVSVATDGPVDALSDLAKKMGAETAFSANEAADAMLELAKGGMTAAQIEGGALAATMKLAAAGGIGLADASTYVSNSMAAFGLKAKDADSVTVALAGAANASSASVESLGMGLSQAAAAAVNAGLSLQETTGVLSLFDSVGLKGSDAGTSLKSMLNSLIPTTEKASQAMADANLDFVDAEGNFVGVANMAEQLKRGLGKLSEAQRTQALETIFGSDGMRAASALMRGGAEEVRKYTEASRDQATTTKLANAAMEGTAGAMERAQGSIETAGLAVGEVLAPYVEKAAAKVEELANAFSNASPATQEMIVKGLALAAVVGPLSIGVGALASSLSKIIGVATAVKGALATTTIAADGTTSSTGKLAGVARKAAGIGGMLALADGLQGAAKEGSTFGNVMQSAAGGAGIGAMFGPVGALVGAGVGGGLAALAGGFAETAEEAQAARLELLKTEGFANAKADADTLATALQGVTNAYGKVARAAVEGSFTGKDGKLDADIAKLRELGVSMDTIVSATMGQADAQRIVESAVQKSLGTQKSAAAEAKAAYDGVKDGLRDVVTASGQVIKNGESLSSEEVRIYEDAWRKAAGKVAETETHLRTFGARADANTGVIRENREAVAKLVDQLNINLKQYRSWPKEARTRIEADGLPQTIRDAMRLIGDYKELQNFRSIKALVEATNAPLTINQIETLTKRYNLTPKQVKTLVQAVGVEAEGGKVDGYRGKLNSIPPRVTTTVHTQYTYSGLKDPTRGRDGRTVAPKLNTQDAANDGYTYGDQLGVGVTTGLLRRAPQVNAAARGLTVEFLKGTADKGDEAGKAGEDKAKKVANRAAAYAPQLEAVGNLLTESFADGIVGSSSHVAEVMRRLMDKLHEIGNRGATRLASSAGAQLAKLGDQYARAADELAKAQGALAAFSAAREAVVNRQSALANAGGDLGALTFGEDPEGEPLAATSDRVIGALASVRDAAVNFDTTLVALKNAGLSQDAIDQLIAKGPEAAAATAQAILAGGPEAIAQINALQTQIATAGLSIQSQSSQTMYDAGVAAQTGLINGLESQMGVLEEKMKGIARAMVRAIRKALRIKSPSRVMDELGTYTGAGFAQGLDSTTRAVARAADKVSRAALVDPITIPAPTLTDPSRRAGVIAQRQLAATAQPYAMPSIRVFIGERELTDIVDVQIGDTLAPLRTMSRQGAI